MGMFFNEEAVTKALNQEIKRQIDEAMDAIIEKAKTDLEARLRKETAQIACSLAKQYRIDIDRHEIRIVVRNET